MVPTLWLTEEPQLHYPVMGAAQRLPVARTSPMPKFPPGINQVSKKKEKTQEGSPLCPIMDYTRSMVRKTSKAIGGPNRILHKEHD